ncbi:hypothetical protein LB518_22795 [Mesorhizobium sp. BR1-1-16]|uniref:STY1053 family phage-associated protein n=1 Tax=Mesorhizobium sp. BR1-1-16 TaxID=2876653 RepID=UPI001CCF6895|nr:hypothetical protein [Mesorhizobium sp. BR1-1-16]MBZ9939143.1 hypothetical protein [Mesorhizobium sp. BR1-1-16]
MRLTIARPFTLLLSGNQRLSFAAGEQEVPDEHADHWYVQAHVVKPEPDDAAPTAESAPPEDDRTALIVEATSLGITVDGRWGIDRIKSAIAGIKADGK